MIAWILFGLSSIVATAAIVVAVRAGKRLLEFDELFELLQHEMNTNINYFGKLLDTPIFSNSPEIVEANKNMALMRVRLVEFLTRQSELRGKDLPPNQGQE